MFLAKRREIFCFMLRRPCSVAKLPIDGMKRHSPARVTCPVLVCFQMNSLHIRTLQATLPALRRLSRALFPGFPTSKAPSGLSWRSNLPWRQHSALLRGFAVPSAPFSAPDPMWPFGCRGFRTDATPRTIIIQAVLPRNRLIHRCGARPNLADECGGPRRERELHRPKHPTPAPLAYL
jgi:hypothetical protein